MRARAGAGFSDSPGPRLAGADGCPNAHFARRPVPYATVPTLAGTLAADVTHNHPVVAPWPVPPVGPYWRWALWCDLCPRGLRPDIGRPNSARRGVPFAAVPEDGVGSTGTLRARNVLTLQPGLPPPSRARYGLRGRLFFGAPPFSLCGHDFQGVSVPPRARTLDRVRGSPPLRPLRILVVVRRPAFCVPHLGLVHVRTLLSAGYRSGGSETTPDSFMRP